MDMGASNLWRDSCEKRSVPLLQVTRILTILWPDVLLKRPTENMSAPIRIPSPHVDNSLAILSVGEALMLWVSTGELVRAYRGVDIPHLY